MCVIVESVSTIPIYKTGTRTRSKTFKLEEFIVAWDDTRSDLTSLNQGGRHPADVNNELLSDRVRQWGMKLFTLRC